MVNEFIIDDVHVRLVRIPVDPPRGDAIQRFDALELPMVEVVDRGGRRGVRFGYPIGRLRLPFDTPGHGIEFNPDALEEFTVWADRLSSSRAHRPA
jgi:hypothetical protein